MSSVSGSLSRKGVGVPPEARRSAHLSSLQKALSCSQGPWDPFLGPPSLLVPAAPMKDDHSCQSATPGWLGYRPSDGSQTCSWEVIFQPSTSLPDSSVTLSCRHPEI